MSSECERYQTFLKRIPRPGSGIHQALFRGGCMGCRAGLTPDVVIEDIRTHMPAGSRHVSDDEIVQGVEAGFVAVAGGKPATARISPRLSPDALKSILRSGKNANEKDIRARSIIPLNWPDHEAGWRVLDALYGKNELVFIGDDAWAGRIGETIRPAGEWVAVLKRMSTVPFPKILVNPLSGKPAPKKSGTGETLRGDACVAAHRFVVAEFDGLSIEDQLAFWFAVPHLPVAALIHSGKKSIHAWLRVDCAGRDEWEKEIEQTLFPGYLEPLGLDPACKNASRLSRMPGHIRNDTGLIQKCIYLAPHLAPQGRSVNC